MSTYVCVTCSRDVDPIEEPSPGEPRRCSDCATDALREALMGWGRES